MQEELTINPQTNKPSFYRSKEFGFFLDNFILKSHDAINPMTTPAKTERNITIARDASNFQKRNEIATGIAFWTEKTVTTVMMINTIINVIIFSPFFLSPPFLKLNQQRIVGGIIKRQQKNAFPILEVYLFFLSAQRVNSTR